MGYLFLLALTVSSCCCSLLSGFPRLTCDERPDAIDLAPDDNYYFFVGSYVYSANKDSALFSVPQPITEVFATIQYPVIAAFSVGPDNGQMYIVDSSSGNNMKIFKFDQRTAGPRQPLLATTLTTVFPKAPQPLYAAATVVVPGIGTSVYLFGSVGGQRTHLVFSFNEGTRQFTYVPSGTSSSVQREFPTELTAAATYRFPNNGSEAMFVFDASRVGKFVFGGTGALRPQQVAICPPWVPKVLNGFCGCEPAKVPSGPPRLTCDERPDSIDLAPDDNFYFFIGAYLYTANKDTGVRTAPQLITDIFATVQWPVIAAASIGPLNSRMFIVDSATPNNLKIYNFANSGIPRQPLQTVPLLTVFPQAPQPLMAMASTYVDHQQIMLFGMINGERRVLIGRFDAATTFNSFVAFNETHRRFGNTDITTATTYRYPNNGPEILYYFNTTTVALATFNPTVVGHAPTRLATCPLWVPPVLNPFCLCNEGTTPTPPVFTTPSPNVIPVPPAMTCSEIPDAVDLAPDDHYYYFIGGYFYTVHKVTNAVAAPQLITNLFPTVQYPVIAAFSTDLPNARMIIVDSASPVNNVKYFQFMTTGSVPATAPRPLISTGSLDTYFPKPKTGPYAFGPSSLQPLTAAVATNGSVLFFGRLVNGLDAYVTYKFDVSTTAFTWVGFNDQPQEYARNVKAGTAVYVPNEGVPGYYTYSNTGNVNYKKAGAAVAIGPVPAASCPSWVLPAVSPMCCLRPQILTTLTPPVAASTTPTATRTTIPTTITATTSTTVPLTTTTSTATTTSSTTTASTTSTAKILSTSYHISTPQSTLHPTTSTVESPTPVDRPLDPECGGDCCDSIVAVEGWRTVPSSTDETIVSRETATSGRHCLSLCQSTEPRCRLVSYDFNTLSCVGFTGKSRPLLKRDFDAVLVAATEKTLYPPDQAYSCQHNSVQGEGKTVKVEYAGNKHVCRSLCVVHPGCIYAELSGTTCAMHICPSVGNSG